MKNSTSLSKLDKMWLEIWRRRKSLRFFGDKSGVTVDHVQGGLSENVKNRRRRRRKESLVWIYGDFGRQVRCDLYD